MELKLAFSRCKVLRINKINILYQMNKYISYSSLTDAYLDSLLVEEGSKKELSLSKYFKNSKNMMPPMISSIREIPNCIKIWNNCSSENDRDLISHIELEMKNEKSIPNSKLYFLLTYFVKNGDANGVRAVQQIVKKNNNTHFKLHSEYKHYLAEALWISGKIENSLELFSIAYNNILVRPKVVIMLNCLFPLLISEHSELLLYKTVNFIEQFSAENNDHILLASIWKELFQSVWFTDQQLSKELIQRNHKLLNLIQFMIPSMGKMLLKEHNIDSFYRLLEFTLEKELNQDGTLIRLLFDYYYIHRNIERCSAVVKYANNYCDSPLTEDQQRRYINLLLNSKNAYISKCNIKKPQNLKYKF